MSKILLFVNPNARQGQRCSERVRAWLAAEGHEILNCDPAHANEPPNSQIRRLGSQASAVLVGGGDGSVNAILPSLLETKLPVLLIPLGTANNLARTLGLPNDPEGALALLRAGRILEIDVGLANGIPFMNVIGLGLSTQVNRMVRSSLKRWLGPFAFVWMAFKVIRRMSPFRIHVNCDGHQHRAKSWQLTICNGRNYGSGLTIHEDASLRDQKLHALSTEVKKWWHTFRLIPALLSGKFSPQHDVTVFEGAKILVETHHPMHVDIDGDVKTKTPLEVSVLPRALKIYLPPRESVRT